MHRHSKRDRNAEHDGCSTHYGSPAGSEAVTGHVYVTAESAKELMTRLQDLGIAAKITVDADGRFKVAPADLTASIPATGPPAARLCLHRCGAARVTGSRCPKCCGIVSGPPTGAGKKSQSLPARSTSRLR